MFIEEYAKVQSVSKVDKKKIEEIARNGVVYTAVYNKIINEVLFRYEYFSCFPKKVTAAAALLFAVGHNVHSTVQCIRGLPSIFPKLSTFS